MQQVKLQIDYNKKPYTQIMRIPEVSEFCFLLLTFSRTIVFIFLFTVLSFNVMRLSIGSVVIVLVA